MMGYSIETYHGEYNRVARTDSVKYIVVHYVGDGNSSAGSARRNCVYFSGGNRNASAHYFIDDGSIYEYANPSAYATWHVGDGKGRYGVTNANSVGIEVCNNGGPFTEAEVDRLAWLVQKLMAQFGVPASRVVRHYDASRKQCPLYYVQNSSAWDALRARITGGTVSGDTSSCDLGDTRYTGPLMVTEWQSQLGTDTDGKISNQSTYIRSKVLVNVEGKCFDGNKTGKDGSSLVKAVQRLLNAEIGAGLDVDGLFGHGTTKWLQRWLNKKLGLSLDDDGYYGPATSSGVGTALEKGLFK